MKMFFLRLARKSSEREKQMCVLYSFFSESTLPEENREEYHWSIFQVELISEILLVVVPQTEARQLSVLSCTSRDLEGNDCVALMFTTFKLN